MSRHLLRFLKTAAARADTPPDGELLRRYTSTQKEPAFEMLVCRHAPAGWAACRHVLQNETDAEDAFQTTFLALAR